MEVYLGFCDKTNSLLNNFEEFGWKAHFYLMFCLWPLTKIYIGKLVWWHFYIDEINIEMPITLKLICDAKIT